MKLKGSKHEISCEKNFILCFLFILLCRSRVFFVRSRYLSRSNLQFFSLWNQHLYFIRLSSITSKKQRMKVQNNEFHSWQASLLVCIYLVSSVWILSSIIQFAISSTYFTLRITKQSLYREISYYKFFVFKEPFKYLT